MVELLGRRRRYNRWLTECTFSVRTKLNCRVAGSRDGLAAVRMPGDSTSIRSARRQVRVARNFEAERLGCVELDYQLEFDGAVYRQLGLPSLAPLARLPAKAALDSMLN